MDNTIEARLAALEERVDALGAENERLRERLAAPVEAPRGSRREATDEPVALHRRALLGKAGAAALGGAALAATAGVGSAAAESGDPLLLGTENGASAGTSLAGHGTGSVLSLFADGLTDHVLDVSGGQALGAALKVSGPGPTTVLVQAATGTAVDAQALASGTGLAASSSQGTGMSAGSGSGTALVARSLLLDIDDNPAVLAEHSGGGKAVEAVSTGVAIVATGGRAALRITPAATSGPPTTTSHSVGEVRTDSTGAVYTCTVGGLASKWRRLAASWPGFDPGSASGTGGAINLLATPFRLFDSRPGTTAPLGGAGALQPSTNTTVQVTGTVPVGGGDPVPTGAVGLLCTVTVTTTEGAGGFLKAFPAGGTVPGTSTLNWFGPGQNLATTTIVRLSTAGAMTLRSGSNPTQVLVDVIGFLA